MFVFYFHICRRYTFLRVTVGKAFRLIFSIPAVTGMAWYASCLIYPKHGIGTGYKRAFSEYGNRTRVEDERLSTAPLTLLHSFYSVFN